jgi:hypothetical protein
MQWAGNHPVATGLGLYGAANAVVPEYRKNVVTDSEKYRNRDTLLPIAAAAVPATLASAFMK